MNATWDYHFVYVSASIGLMLLAQAHFWRLPSFEMGKIEF